MTIGALLHSRPFVSERRYRRLVRAFISDAHTRKMDLNTKSLRAYWENYERSLDGDPWDILNDVEDPTAFGVESWTDILERLLEGFMVIIIIILVVIILYCLNRRKRGQVGNDLEVGSVEKGPPGYEEVIEKEKAELECLKDLPTYQEAVSAEISYSESKETPSASG